MTLSKAPSFSLSALRLARPGSLSKRSANNLLSQQRLLYLVAGVSPPSSQCCPFRHRHFSTHSFVLDPKIHGKAAFQGIKPGTRFCPTDLYMHLSESGHIDEDPIQLEALEKLESTYDALLQGSRPSRRSLYIYGPAGSGKSMVMDLFHFCLEQNGIRTKRQHFHEFLYEMHRKLHQLHLKQRNVSTHDFIRQISDDMGQNLDVLCFDELAITSIQDCTLLVPLFSQIFRTNICLVTTSNRHPDNLYEDGLNRHLYFPEFLRILHENSQLASVRSEDYREREFLKERSAESIAKIFFGTLEADDAETFIEKLGLQRRTLELTIGYGRKMLVDSCSEDETSARFDARKLFGGPPFLGADDYNAICEKFSTIVLDGLWVLDVADHNEAKRITNFLDCAYEMHVRVVCINMEEVAVENLFHNLLPLETLSLKEILNVGKPAEEIVPAEVVSQQCGPTHPSDQDTVTSSMAEAVKSIKNLPIATSQQSCYFLSEDHKDWSVESKIVQTSSRKQHIGATLKQERVECAEGSDNMKAGDAGHDSGGQRDRILGKLEGVLPKEPDQSGRSKQIGSGHADNFDDGSSEQHSVKGVFVAAVASLHETGFAVKRAISRLHEMQTTKYLKSHSAKRLSLA